jgi:hypothetical protein
MDRHEGWREGTKSTEERKDGKRIGGLFRWCSTGTHARARARMNARTYVRAHTHTEDRPRSLARLLARSVSYLSFSSPRSLFPSPDGPQPVLVAGGLPGSIFKWAVLWGRAARIAAQRQIQVLSLSHTQSVCLSICLSVYLSVCLSVCLSSSLPPFRPSYLPPFLPPPSLSPSLPPSVSLSSSLPPLLPFLSLVVTDRGGGS